MTVVPTHVRLRKGEGGVTAATVLKCEQLTTIYKSELDAEALGAALPRERMAEVLRAVMLSLGVPVLPDD
ncbi:MAG TPA: type II toxin-antitoxin system PemK/MazF family toxin [Kofleriaceae bacterium]|jgi:mRNA-degrading endonuclease toxin of MazEF toxin-antitoxin module